MFISILYVKDTNIHLQLGMNGNTIYFKNLVLHIWCSMGLLSLDRDLFLQILEILFYYFIENMIYAFVPEFFFYAHNSYVLYFNGIIVAYYSVHVLYVF